VGEVSPLWVERPEGCMWKFWPEDWDCEERVWVWEWEVALSREDSTLGKGSRSGGGGVRVRWRGEAL